MSASTGHRREVEKQFRLVSRDACPPEWLERARSLHQRIASDHLLVDNLFQKCWEFPNTLVKERCISRGDVFIGDLRLDFFHNQHERSLCRVCGRHVLKQKFATEHYHNERVKGRNCWKEVARRLNIVEAISPPQQCRLIGTSTTKASESTGWSSPYSGRGGPGEFITDVDAIAHDQYAGAEAAAVEELQRAERVACGVWNVAFESDEFVTQLLGGHSDTKSPFYTVEMVHPRVFPSSVCYAANYILLKIRFNRQGARHLQALWEQGGLCTVDYQDGVFGEAQPFIVNETTSPLSLEQQGMAFLRAVVPRREPRETSISVRIPITITKSFHTPLTRDTQITWQDPHTFCQIFGPTVEVVETSTASIDDQQQDRLPLPPIPREKSSSLPGSPHNHNSRHPVVSPRRLELPGDRGDSGRAFSAPPGSPRSPTTATRQNDASSRNSQVPGIDGQPMESHTIATGFPAINRTTLLPPLSSHDQSQGSRLDSQTPPPPPASKDDLPLPIVSDEITQASVPPPPGYHSTQNLQYCSSPYSNPLGQHQRGLHRSHNQEQGRSLN